MKKFFTFLCCGILLSTLVACGGSVSNKEKTSTTTRPTVSYIADEAYTCQPVSIYDIVKLDAEQKIKILDVLGSRLLVNIYSNYQQDDPNFSEEGYNAITEKIIEFNFETGEISNTYSFTDGYCSDAIFLDDNSIVYITLSPGFLTDYKIIKVNGGVTQEIASGCCYANEFDDPHLARLGNASFAYSYSNVGFASNDFGVNIVSAYGEITQQVHLTDDGKTEHLRTTLSDDGTRYIYYTAIDGKGTIIVGDQSNILHQFELPLSERVFDFSLLGEFIFFSLEDISDENSVGKIVMKDLNGKTVAEENYDPLFRVDSILGIDLKYQIHAVQFINGNITIFKMDLPKNPVLFYNLGTTSFLLHYDYNTSPQKLGVFLLKFS